MKNKIAYYFIRVKFLVKKKEGKNMNKTVL